MLLVMLTTVLYYRNGGNLGIGLPWLRKHAKWKTLLICRVLEPKFSIGVIELLSDFSFLHITHEELFQRRNAGSKRKLLFDGTEDTSTMFHLHRGRDLVSRLGNMWILTLLIVKNSYKTFPLGYHATSVLLEWLY